MNLPAKTPARRLFVLGAAAAVVAGLGLLLMRHFRTPVPPNELLRFLDRTAAGPGFAFVSVRTSKVSQEGAVTEVAVEAQARTQAPLYVRIEAADYLKRVFQLDPESAADARRLLADPGREKTADAAAVGPYPEDPYALTILQLSAGVDAAFMYRGLVDARFEAGAWSFALLSGGFEGSQPSGSPRSAFGRDAVVVGEGAGDARIREAVAAFRAFAKRLTDIRQRTADLAEARQRRFIEEVAPGRLFKGTATEAGDQRGTPLYLEITSVTPEHEVTARLRNEGGWHNARLFQGSWEADDLFEHPTLHLASSAGEAIRNAGPFVENTQPWTFTLAMDAQGELSETGRRYRYEFQPIKPDLVPALRSRLDAEFQGALSATVPGLLYQGTATSKATGTVEPILLQFESRGADGTGLEARVESTTRSWKRRLHGVIVANARRSGGQPIRLESDASEAVEDAPVDSVLGFREELNPVLGTAAGHLAGEDAAFTYQVVVAGPEEQGKLEAAQAARARSFMEVFRDGISFDGTMREEQGFVTHARLEILHVDRGSGVVSARVSSASRSGVFREFRGMCDPSGGSLVLEATNKGAFVADGSFDLPFLTSASPASLHLALSGGSLTGRILRDPRWVIEFPVSAFLGVATESSDPGAPAADGSVFPVFPKDDGVYLLTSDGWKALAVHQGHLVEESVRDAASDIQLPRSLLEIVAMGITQLSKKDQANMKVSYLQFGGKDPRPVSTGSAVVLLCIGLKSAENAALEIAPAETSKDGQRRIQVARGTGAGIDFGPQHLATYVRQASPRAVLLTTTSALVAGPYVLNVEGGAEFVHE